MAETEKQQQKRLKKARADIQQILINENVENALIVVSSNDAWEGCVYGSSKSIAHAYISGMDKQFISNELLRDILSQIISNYK